MFNRKLPLQTFLFRLSTTEIIPPGALRGSSAVTFFNDLNQPQTQGDGAGAAPLSHGSPGGRSFARSRSINIKQQHTFVPPVFSEHKMCHMRRPPRLPAGASVSCAADKLDLSWVFFPHWGWFSQAAAVLSLLEVSVSKLPHGFLPAHLFMCVSGVRGCGGGGGGG